MANGTALGRLRAILTGETAEFDKAMKSALRTVEQTGRRMQTVGRQLTIGLSAPLAGVSALAVKTAADFEESSSRVVAVFDEQGKAALDWSRTTGRALGRSRLEMTDFVGQVGSLFTGVGFAADESLKLSQAVTQLGLDMASFNNRSDPEAIRALQSALVGNTEALRSFNVIITAAEANTRALAATGKDSVQQLTEQERVLGRLLLILERSTKQQGDLLATNSSFTNQLKAFRASISDARLELGERLIPASAALLRVLNQLVSQIPAIISGMDSWVLGLLSVSVALPPVILGVGLLITTIGALPAVIALAIASLGLLIAGASAFPEQFKALGAAIGAAIVAGIAAKFRDLLSFMASALSKFIETAQFIPIPAIQIMVLQARGLASALESATEGLDGFVSGMDELARFAFDQSGLDFDFAGQVKGAMEDARKAAVAEMEKLQADIRALLGQSGEIAAGIAEGADVQRFFDSLDSLASKTADAEAQLSELRGTAGAIAERELAKAAEAFRRVASDAGLSGAALEGVVSEYEDAFRKFQAITEEAQRTKRLQDSIEAPFRNALENIQRAWGDTLRGMFDRGISSFKDFFGTVKDLALDFVAQFGSLILLRPEILAGAGGGLSGAIGRVFGTGGGAAGSQASAQTGTNSVLGLLGSSLKQLKEIGVGIFDIALTGRVSVEQQAAIGNFLGKITSNTGAINTIIAGIGPALSGLGGALAGAFLNINRGTTALVAGVIGGIAGGIAGSFFGLGGVGAGLGGLLGGAAGALLDNRLGLSTVDTILGLFEPAIGNIRTVQAARSQGVSQGKNAEAAIAGGVFSAFFGPAAGLIVQQGILGAFEDPEFKAAITLGGKKLSDVLQEGVNSIFGAIEVDFQGIRSIGEGDVFSARFASGFPKVFSDVATQLALELSAAEIARVESSFAGGITLTADRKTAQRAFNELFGGLLTTILSAATTGGRLDIEQGAAVTSGLVKDLPEFLQRVFRVQGAPFKSPAFAEKQLEQALAFLQGRGELVSQIEAFERFAGIAPPLTEAAQAIDEVNKRIEELILLAPQFGIATDKLRELGEAAIEALGEQFLEGFAQQVLEFTDPLQAALDANNRALEEALREAEALGVETILIRRRFSLEEERILRSFASRAQDLLESLLGGPQSTLAPLDRLANAQGRFSALRDAFLGGDTSVINDLVDAASNLLDVARPLLASSQAFERIFELVVATLAGLPGVDTTGLSLPGAQHGGSFRVGAGAGIDRGVPGLRVAAGELVTVTPAGGQGLAEGQRDEMIDRQEQGVVEARLMRRLLARIDERDARIEQLLARLARRLEAAA